VVVVAAAAEVEVEAAPTSVVAGAVVAEVEAVPTSVVAAVVAVGAAGPSAGVEAEAEDPQVVAAAAVGLAAVAVNIFGFREPENSR
jgi:hypothetical protein